jgi:hypothetical protein
MFDATDVNQSSNRPSYNASSDLNSTPCPESKPSSDSGHPSLESQVLASR